MIIFQSRIFWKEIDIPTSCIRKKFKEYFGDQDRVIDDREDVIKVLGKLLGGI